jgi:hypothetical protein
MLFRFWCFSRVNSQLLFPIFENSRAPPILSIDNFSCIRLFHSSLSRCFEFLNPALTKQMRCNNNNNNKKKKKKKKKITNFFNSKIGFLGFPVFSALSMFLISPAYGLCFYIDSLVPWTDSAVRSAPCRGTCAPRSVLSTSCRLCWPR